MKAQKIDNCPISLLAESPIYLNNKFYWIDIKSGIMHSYDGDFQSFDMKEMITFIVPSKNNIVYSTKNSIKYFDIENNKSRDIFNLNFRENVRFNDGKCDASGRLYAGTMDMNEKNPDGSLYMFDSSYHEVLNNITISNGTIWSSDNKKMYYIDSPTKKIRVFDYDLKNGKILTETESIDVNFSSGVPDGMTIDSHDNIYVCFYGGGHVLAFDKNGRNIKEIELSVNNVSSCIFGGKNMDELFITTAKDCKGNGGEVYTYKNDIAGRPSYEYKLS